jgi:hypothetical protein
MRPVEEMYNVQPGFRLCISTSFFCSSPLVGRPNPADALVSKHQTGFVLLASLRSYAIGLGWGRRSLTLALQAVGR